jgi:hypothetical protein
MKTCWKCLSFWAMFLLIVGGLVGAARAADPECLGAENAPLVLEVDAAQGQFNYCTPGLDSNGTEYPEKTVVNDLTVNDYPMVCISTEVGGPVIHSTSPIGPRALVQVDAPNLTYDRWVIVQCSNVKGAGLVSNATLVRFPVGGTPGAPFLVPAP